MARKKSKKKPSELPGDLKPKLAKDSGLDKLEPLSSLGSADIIPLAEAGIQKLEAGGERLGPDEWIKGRRIKYSISGGKITDLSSGKEPPMISGLQVYEVPLEQAEIMKVFQKGWDGAEEDVKDINEAPGGIHSKRSAIQALLVEADKKGVARPNECMEGHSFYAWICGYRMALYFSLRKFPVLMLAAPTKGIQGKQLAEPSVIEEIETHQQPF